jgi:glycerophosphoryl diester phosphodiesterase
MKYPLHKISLLIGNSKAAEKNIEELGFKPDIYSPNYKLVNEKELAYLKSKNIMVIPWTVNEVKDMKKLIDMGIDGMITDYPNRYLENFQANP